MEHTIHNAAGTIYSTKKETEMRARITFGLYFGFYCMVFSACDGWWCACYKRFTRFVYIRKSYAITFLLVWMNDVSFSIRPKINTKIAIGVSIFAVSESIIPLTFSRFSVSVHVEFAIWNEKLLQLTYRMRARALFMRFTWINFRCMLTRLRFSAFKISAEFRGLSI